MPGIRTDIEIRGLAELLRKINRMKAQLSGAGVGGKTELHRRYGIQALNWIDDNFRQAGALTGSKWAKLSKNTIAGRRKGSSNPLLNTGLLRASYSARATAQDARVGSPMLIALWHEEGTDPYPITPKKASVLAFPVAKGFYKTAGQRKRATVKANFSSLITRKTYRKGQLLGFARRVNHPGLPARPMLPRQGMPTIEARLIKTTINWLRETGLFRGGVS